MKKVIFSLAAALMVSTLFTNCSSATEISDAEKDVEIAELQLEDANMALLKAHQDSVLLFRSEANQKFSEFSKTISDINAKMLKERKENQASYKKELAVLELKQKNLQKKLDEYKDDGKQDWNSFKSEFNHDMDELGKAFSDIITNNVK